MLVGGGRRKEIDGEEVIAKKKRKIWKLVAGGRN